MNRRQFLTASAAAGLAPWAGISAQAAVPPGSEREVYELRQITLTHQAQKDRLDAFLGNAALPALRRAGVGPVGVFYPLSGFSPAYMVLRHPSLESVVTLTYRLSQDEELLERGNDFIDAPASSPSYERIESSLLIAFRGMPRMDRPIRSPGRIVQLRTYESPSIKAGQKKIEMFNDAGEMRIFREVGLHPVFFGETIVGLRMPCLNYMLVFHSQDELKANWHKFGSHPDWKQLSRMPEYADKRIISHITNRVLRPAAYSEI